MKPLKRGFPLGKIMISELLTILTKVPEWATKIHKRFKRPLKIIFESGKEPFERGFPNNLVRRFSIGIENSSSERLHHCCVTIQDVNPKANLEADSSLRLSSPQKKTFGINARDTEYIDIVQFDELNGYFDNLGIELMCYSVHGFTNLPLEHHYTLTIRASAEKGRFAEEEFNLRIEGRKLHFTKLTA